MTDRMATKHSANGGGPYRWLVRLLLLEGFLIAAVLFLVFLPWPWSLLFVLGSGMLDYMLIRVLAPPG